MPTLTRVDSNHHSEILVWRVTEIEAYFASKLVCTPAEKEIIQGLSMRKRMEWLSSRYMIQLLSGRPERAPVTKDQWGKPHVADSNHHISISHSRDLTAVIASPICSGIDIQYYVDKIARIAHKFATPKELEDRPLPITEIVHLHIIWGAKESLYKAYGKRGLDFRKHLRVDAIEVSGKIGTAVGYIDKDDFRSSFDITFHLYDHHVLVYAEELS